MDGETLVKLVNEWHEMADGFEGYESTISSGHGVPLVFLANQTKDGEAHLMAMSLIDLLKMVLDDGAVDVSKIPYSSKVIDDQ